MKDTALLQNDKEVSLQTVNSSLVKDNEQVADNEKPKDFTDEDTEKEMSEDFDKKNIYNYSCIRRYFGPIKDGSLRGGILAIVSITFGGGCLSFPYAMAMVGPVLGTGIFLIMGILSFITIKYLLTNAFYQNAMDFNGLVEKTLGRKVRIANDCANLILQTGLLISYQYIISSLSLQVLNYFFGLPCEGVVKVIQISVAAICLQIPLSMLKDISKLQYVSLVGTIAILFSVLIILVECPFYLMNYVKDNSISLVPPKGIKFNFIDTIGILLYGFSSHNGIFQTFQELKRPGERRCHKVLNRAFYLELALYLPLTLAGFFSTFYDTPDVFLKRENLPQFKNDYFIIIVRIFLVLTLNSSIAVNYNILRMSINSLFFNGKPRDIIDKAFVVGIYICTNLITYFIRNVGTFLSFLGGICAVLICFITPILIDIKVKPELKPKYRLYFNYVFLVIICVIAFACTGKSVYDFINQGPPEPICPSND